MNLKNPSLPLQPTSTSLRYHFVPLIPGWPRIYGPRYPNCLSVTSGRRVNWDTAATTSGGHDRDVYSVAFFPDGRKLASGSVDGTVRVWDTKLAKQISGPFTVHTATVRSVAVSPDGRLIASGSDDRTLRIFDSNTGACPLGPIAAHSKHHSVSRFLSRWFLASSPAPGTRP